MDIQQLKYFLAVSRTGSFTKASEELYISRQAVTKSIRQMEEELGAALFTRDKNLIALTPLGERFTREAEKVVRCFDGFEEEMKRYAADQERRIRVLIGAAVMIHLTPETFAGFGEKYPQILLSVSEADNREMLRRLQAGNADVCLIGSSAAHLREFNATLVAENRLCVCCNVKNPLSKKSALTIQDLRGQPMVGHGEGYDLHQFYVEKCREAGFEPTFSIISTDPQIAIRLVEQNRSLCFGISDLSERRPKPNAPVRIIPLLLGEEDTWGIFAVTRPGEIRSAPQRLLIEYLVKHSGGR